MPKDTVVVTGCLPRRSSDKKYKLSKTSQRLWTGKIQQILFTTDQMLRSNLLQGSPQSYCYRLMQRVVEYPVERSSFNRWVTTKRKKLQYSPFSTNLISLFQTEKFHIFLIKALYFNLTNQMINFADQSKIPKVDELKSKILTDKRKNSQSQLFTGKSLINGQVNTALNLWNESFKIHSIDYKKHLKPNTKEKLASLAKHGDTNTLPIRNKLWIASKKFTSFHSAIYLDWYAFSLRPYDFLPAFGPLYKTLSTKNQPINSKYSLSTPTLINEGERRISLIKKAASLVSASPISRAMPYLAESDQITFATNDSVLLSHYQENITNASKMQRVTVWQSSLSLNKEYFSRFFEFSKRMATSLRWHSRCHKTIISQSVFNEVHQKSDLQFMIDVISKADIKEVDQSASQSHLSNSKTVFPFFIFPMKQKQYSSILTSFTKGSKLTFLLDFLFAWNKSKRKHKTHLLSNVIAQHFNNGRDAITFTNSFRQLRWLLMLTELTKRFGDLSEEETFFDYQALLGYGAVAFKNKEKNIKTKFSYLFPGQLVAYGEKIDQNIATTESGQIFYVDSQRATLRKAQTVLIYSQAILSVLSGEWIKKGTPLMALSYQKLVTGDIVQGLPKIEQFFEAPLLRDGTFWSDSLQAKLNLFFQEHREKLPLAEAVRKGFSDIQRVLVEGVQRVYISQGVLIADKHLEVIVRQMTCKGRILYSGDTGFLRNELVALDKIESVNQVTYGQKALYHPQVRGITDASLESESFLSAASFQETTRVLSRDSVIGKTDLMRGLKERVIVGELIQAGTGLANNSVYNFLLD